MRPNRFTNLPRKPPDFVRKLVSCNFCTFRLRLGVVKDAAHEQGSGAGDSQACWVAPEKADAGAMRASMHPGSALDDSRQANRTVSDSRAASSKFLAAQPTRSGTVFLRCFSAASAQRGCGL